MKKDAQWIYNAIDLAFSACGTIEEAGACDVCPLHVYCLDDNGFNYVASSATKSDWEDFLALSDDVIDYVNERDYIADLADRQRKEIEYGY